MDKAGNGGGGGGGGYVDESTLFSRIEVSEYSGRISFFS